MTDRPNQTTRVRRPPAFDDNGSRRHDRASGDAETQTTEPETAAALDRLADNLRHCAFPGARPWRFADIRVKEQWRAVARYAEAYMDKERDRALRMAVAAAHDLGDHKAAQAIRALRQEYDIA